MHTMESYYMSFHSIISHQSKDRLNGRHLHLKPTHFGTNGDTQKYSKQSELSLHFLPCPPVI